jgi:hypothetical protein
VTAPWCLMCGEPLPAEDASPARCPRCGWVRKAADVPSPPSAAPREAGPARGFLFGCLVSLLLAVLGFLLLVARAGAPWSKE